MKLVPLKESPLSRSSAYKYHSTKQYPRLIIKVVGKLFVDLDEWEQMVEEAREKQIKEAEEAISGQIIEGANDDNRD